MRAISFEGEPGPGRGFASFGDRRVDLESVADQYGGMKAEEAKRLKELERENARLKRSGLL